MAFATGPTWPRSKQAAQTSLSEPAPPVLYYAYVEDLGLREINGEGIEDEVMLRFLAFANPDHIFFASEIHRPEYREPFTINKIA